MPKTVTLTESAEPDDLARIRNAEYWDADDLYLVTTTPASTWRHWAIHGGGPPSFKLGKRRLWRRTVVEAWLAEQEQAQ